MIVMGSADEQKMNSSDAPAMRVLGRDALDRAVDVAARAFHDDPVLSYVMGDARTRDRTFARFIRPTMAAALRAGTAYGVGDPVDGVALWLRPGESETFFSFETLGILFDLNVWRILPRALSVFGQAERMRRQYAAQPHYYLQMLVVAPEAQGRGVGSRLVRPFLAEADAQGMAVYLETSSERNVALYQHWGFDVCEAYPIRQAGRTFWSMLRPPNAAPEQRR